MSTDFSRIAIDGHTLGRRAGGNESYVLGLLHGLNECGFDGEVVLYLAPGVELPAALRRLVIERPLASRRAFRRLLVELPSALRRDRPDFAHFQYIGPPRSPCPVTLAIHDTSFLQRPQLLPWKTALRLRRTTGMAVRRSAAIIVPSTWTAETLVDRYPQAAGKTHVVPLAPAVRFDESAPPAADTLPPRFCLYVGRRQQRKNVALLLRAYADATRRERKVPPLLLLGPVSPEDDSLGALAKELGVAERVLIRGYTDAGTLAAAYERADFFCYPCRYEGFGLPLVEAMSHGCAVIAADEGGLPETLGDAGKLVPPDSVPAWSDAIVALAGSPETREELRHAGRRRARQFTWAQTARELLAAAHACVGTPVVDRTGNR